MKKIVTICAAILMTATVFAQSPEKMSYQAVVRDGSNALVTSTAVGMQISILQGSASGSPVYVETQTPTTNANGLVSLEIGAGTVVSGAFSTIDWVNGPYYIKIETDPTGGTSYTITGTSQLLSVPYALHAKNTDSWSIQGDTTYTYNKVSIGSNSPKAKLYVLDNSASPDIEMEAQGDFNPLLSFKRTSSTAYTNYRWFWGMSGNGNIRLRDDITGNDRIRTSTDGKTTINDVMNLTPRATAPSSPSQGDIYYDSTLNKLRVWDGSTWQNCW